MVNEDPAVSSKVSKRKSVRTLLFITGTISLVLGTIGIFLPLLPTTPFLLVTAACYMRSSERMYSWLLNNRWFGEYIRNYQAGRGIPLKTKIVAITLLWTTIAISIIFVAIPRNILIMIIVLLIVAVCVSLHLIRIPTYKKQKDLSTNSSVS